MKHKKAQFKLGFFIIFHLRTYYFSECNQFHLGQVHVVLLGIQLQLVLLSFLLLVLSEHAHFQVQIRFVGHQSEHVEPAHNQYLVVQDLVDNVQCVVQFLDQCVVEGQQFNSSACSCAA